jgi:hypothetical protein
MQAKPSASNRTERIALGVAQLIHLELSQAPVPLQPTAPLPISQSDRAAFARLGRVARSCHPCRPPRVGSRIVTIEQAIPMLALKLVVKLLLALALAVVAVRCPSIDLHVTIPAGAAAVIAVAR